MQIPSGAERFTFPNPRPSSPPPTPGSSNSRQSSSGSHTSPLLNKRYGFIRLDCSPPENIEPRGLGYQFSYQRPQRDNMSSDSSSSESAAIAESEDANSEAESAAPEVDSQSARSEPGRRLSVNVRPVDEDRDFVVEEVSDDDIGYDDVEVIHPDTFEDAESERGQVRSAEVNHDLADKLRDLHCTSNSEMKAFDDVQHARYLRKKKRWSKGGSHKRSHAESVGSNSECDEDVQPLDAQQVGSSARRLRRRTEVLEIKPRTSLLFDDPPKEIEELKYLDDRSVESATIGSDIDEAESLLKSADSSQLHVSEVSEEEPTFPYWLYPMELESDASSPSSASGSAGARRVRR